MAQLPTSRTVLDLYKYSRGSSKQNEHSQHIQNSKDCDWQHHTQPVLRLLLESRKNLEGQSESVRIRVVWTPQKSTQVPIENKQAQEFVVFEDVDLAVIRKHVHPFPLQSIPCKAVYRDNMVGIRYLPLDARSNSSSEYRRFQVTFREPNSAAILVEAIEKVCSCKPSPPNKPTVTTPSSFQSSDPILGTQFSQTTQYLPGVFPRVSTPQFCTTLPTSPFNPEFSRPSSQTPSSLVHNFVLPSSTTLHAHTAYTNTNTTPVVAPQAQIPNLSRQQTIVAQEPSLHDILSKPVTTFSQRNISGLTDNDLFDSTEFQGSQAQPNHFQTSALITPPASSDATLFLPSAMSEPTLPDIPLEKAASTTNPTNDKDALLMSLYEACRMDHLELDELERLVAHILREDGFTELVEKIDSLSRLKALMDD